MERPSIINLIGIVVLALSLVTCGWLVRDGLLALSTQVRDKQLFPVPAEVHLAVGNPEIRMTLGVIKIDPPSLQSEGKATSGTLTIDSLKIEVPASQPAAAD